MEKSMASSETKEQDHTRVAVVGGGLAGLSMAACLGTAGIKTAVIDTGKHPQSGLECADNRTTALIQSSLSLLRACGVWAGCAPHSTPLKTMRIVTRPGGLMCRASETDFHAEETGEESFGYNVPNSLLRQQLCRRLADCNAVTHYFEQRAIDFDNSTRKGSLTLDGGAEISADLVIAADGKNSFLRQRAGVKITSWDYPQTAITCTIAHSLDHNFISTETHYPEGPFVLVPLHSPAGERTQSSIVWVTETARARELLNGLEETFLTALTEKVGPHLGQITCTGKAGSFPLSCMVAEQFYAPRLALIAEAAHAMPPIAAQGLNLSLRDVAELADQVISALSCAQDIGAEDFLRRYDRSRRFDVVTRVAATDSFNRLTSNNSALLHSLRGMGLGLLRRVGPARRALMNTGLNAPTGTPKLMTGQPIPRI